MHVAVLLADCAGTLEISNRLELRGRETENPPAAAVAPAAPATTVGAAAPLPNPGIDLVDVPTAHLELRGHVWATTADYSALTIIPDLETGQSIPQVLQTASLGEVWHNRTIRLSLFEYGQYGGENSAYLLSPTGPSGSLSSSSPSGGPIPIGASPAVQALANPVRLQYGSSRTDLTSQVALSRRWAGTSLLEYVVQGGADASSQAVLPLVYGPRAEVTAKWAATRVDAMETKVTGAHSDASAGPCFPDLLTPLPAGSICQPSGDILQATETWRRRLSRQTEAWLGAGPAFVVARLVPKDPYADALYPAVVAGFQYRSSVEQVRTILRLDAQLAPVVDVRSGIVDDRAQGTVTLEVPLRYVTVLGGLAGTRSVESLLSQPVESVRGSLEVDYKLDPEVNVGAGVRYAWQDQAGFGAFSSGLAFVQATFHAKAMRF